MLRKLLQKQGVSSISLTGEGAYDYFTKEGSVTITGIRRAKGNEASLVYVFGFENIGGTQGAVLKRNTAFTAMTRTKGWLCLTGVGQVARELFKEITGTLEKPGMVNFCVPDKSKIERNLETEAKTRKRKKSKKVEKTASKFYEELLDDDVQFYDSESIEKLEELQRLIAQKLNKQQD